MLQPTRISERRPVGIYPPRERWVLDVWAYKKRRSRPLVHGINFIAGSNISNPPLTRGGYETSRAPRTFCRLKHQRPTSYEVGLEFGHFKYVSHLFY